MIKTFTSLIVLPLLLSLEVGIGPLHRFISGEESAGFFGTNAAAVQVESTAPADCPVCRFMQAGFLLAFILFVSFFLRRCERVIVHEIAFPAEPFIVLPSRGPPVY